MYKGLMCGPFDLLNDKGLVCRVRRGEECERQKVLGRRVQRRTILEQVGSSVRIEKVLRKRLAKVVYTGMDGHLRRGSYLQHKEKPVHRKDMEFDVKTIKGMSEPRETSIVYVSCNKIRDVVDRGTLYNPIVFSTSTSTVSVSVMTPCHPIQV